LHNLVLWRDCILYMSWPLGGRGVYPSFKKVDITPTGVHGSPFLALNMSCNSQRLAVRRWFPVLSWRFGLLRTPSPEFPEGKMRYRIHSFFDKLCALCYYIVDF